MQIWPSERILMRLKTEQEHKKEPLCAYLYDLEALKNHTTLTRAAMPDGCELFYAVKANAEPAILHVLSSILDGFEVASGGELDWVTTHVPERRIIFGGPGKLNSELKDAVQKRVETIHVESFNELKRVEALAQGHPVYIALRINPELNTEIRTKLMMAGGPSPFGIDEEQINTCLNYIRSSTALHLTGFHLHALSHHLDMDAHTDLLRHYLKKFERWRDIAGADVRLLNVGGGIGINYIQPDQQADWPGMMARLGDMLQQMPDAPRIRFELGRYLTASCGFYAAEIIDLKQSYGRWFAICRGGTNHFRTPSAQNHSHPVTVIPGSRRGERQLTNINCTFVGQLCTPKDVLARNISCPNVGIGDVALFPLAGAYGWTISHHHFLRHAPPKMIFVAPEVTSRKEISNVHA